jgi:CRISPR system Cascade subunit CasD
MQDFLTFALVAPIASFGSLAVGERRQGWDRPARSAVLGLVGACLGVEREDTDGQAALAADYALALLCVAPGALLADYHTAQVPSAARQRRFATRAAELRAPSLNTILSRRDYRTDAWHLAALWPRRPAARWDLPTVAGAMASPAFVPYLGRKSCPLGLPLAPVLAPAEDAAAALLARHADGPEARFRARMAPRPAAVLTLAIDAADMPDDVRRLRVEMRRDQPRDRKLWQFDLRPEAVLGLGPA